MDTTATALVSAGTALFGALTGSLGAPFLQRRLADRTSLRNERMTLYADAMLYTHFVMEGIEWAISPMEGPGTTESAIKQRAEMRKVPDAITARMRLIAHKRVRDAWLELRHAEERYRWGIDQDFPELGHPEMRYDFGVPANYGPLVELREACDRFQETCRNRLRVRD